MKKIKLIEERNYYIDFLKFIFSIGIVLYHSWTFTGVFGEGWAGRGYFGVEFYFIVTGYLFIKSFEKSKKEEFGKSSLKFVFNKVKPLLLMIILTWIFGYFLLYRMDGFKTEIIFSNSNISELLLFNFVGFGLNINSALWYLGVMLLVIFLMYPFAYKFKKTYNYYIAPLIVFFTYGIILSNHINIYDPLPNEFLFINGFWRGLILINLGVISYEISNYLKQVKFTTLSKVLLTVMETIIYILLIINMKYNLFGELCLTLLFMFNISLTFSNVCYSKKIFRFSFFKELGKFGFCLFLTNIPIRLYTLSNLGGKSYNKMMIYYLKYVFLASLILYILDKIYNLKFVNRIKSKLVKLFIK